MDVYEITDYKTAVSKAGVNYLQPSDSFQNIENGFVYRQVLQSRQGMGLFAPRLAGQVRVFGIFEFTRPDSTKELLVADQNQLYKWNITTGVFDPIPFGGSMAAYTGFNIGAKDFYVSGTAYPFKNNAARFVFCGEGITPNGAGSAIFFYDGTNVLDFTSVVDNPDYAAPPMGALTSASYCIWFNERINFIVPIIAGIEYNQGTLYSGIRDSSGNGDKFTVAGSGLFQADTYLFITGVTILGQVMVHNYDRMAYVMEKTRDAFNPYFGRAIPGPLGTNAKFSATTWNDKVISMGKTGVLSADSRQNLRNDNKIPNFTADEISQKDFNLTYGGFDRINNQFLWSYKKSTSDMDTQDSCLIYNYEESSWATFDLRVSVFGQTDIGRDLAWDDIDETSGNAAWAQWDTTEELWNRIGIGEAVQKTLAGDDFGFIYELNRDFDDYFTTISAITLGATTTLTVADTAILAGDQVTISGVVGLLNDQGVSAINNFDPGTNTQIGRLFNVLSATPTSIVIDVPSTDLTAYVSGGTLSKVIPFKAETIPFNPYRELGRRCFVSHVEFYIESTGSSMSVDVYADEQSTPFKQNVLLNPSNNLAQAGQWLSMSVDQEANFLTFVMKQTSPAVQFRQTSMRIHCQPGGMTSG